MLRKKTETIARHSCAKQERRSRIAAPREARALAVLGIVMGEGRRERGKEGAKLKHKIVRCLGLGQLRFLTSGPGAQAC